MSKFEQNKPITPTYDKRHGGPYDRGGADAYYQRPFQPHYFVGATYSTARIPQECMTEEEIAAYTAGYKDCDDVKDWR